MKAEFEMINGKKYTIEHNDKGEFLDKIKYEQGNGYFLSTDGTYVMINKIVQFTIKD